MVQEGCGSENLIFEVCNLGLLLMVRCIRCRWLWLWVRLCLVLCGFWGFIIIYIFFRLVWVVMKLVIIIWLVCIGLNELKNKLVLCIYLFIVFLFFFSIFLEECMVLFLGLWLMSYWLLYWFRKNCLVQCLQLLLILFL